MSGEAGNIPGLDSILRGEIMRKDALVNQLLNQNKEVQKEINTVLLWHSFITRPFFGEVDVPCTHFSLAGLGLVCVA